MEDPRFEQLSDGQKQCLRLILAHYQIKAIATELNIHVSSVNDRLSRARRTLGANSSLEAAKMLAEYEQGLGTWIPPTGSKNTVSLPPAATADGVASTVEEPLEEQLADHAWTPRLEATGQAVSGPLIRWPFPTTGRRDNDLSSLGRLAWVLPCAAIALLAILLIAVLTIGLQDVLAELPKSLKRLL